MIHLFIDTNRYLLLYGFPKEDLENVKKLVKLVKEKKITLWLPEQVKIEFYRNKEKIPLQKSEQVKGAISEYKPPQLPEIPEFEKELEELKTLFEEVKKLEEKINSKVQGTIEAIKSKLKNNLFLADEIIKELFSYAKLMRYDNDVIKKAKIRFDLDIPPGKKGSYGDSVIWETLLKEFPEKEELHFVGFDKDFKSNIDDNDFSPFLLTEWKANKNSDIISYKHLGDFTKKKIPEIEQSDRIIKEEERVDKNYLITSTAVRNALKGMTLPPPEWNALMENLNAYRNILAHTSDTLSIPTDVIRQNAEILKNYNMAMNNVMNSIKLPDGIIARAFKGQGLAKESESKESSKESVKENKKEEKNK